MEKDVLVEKFAKVFAKAERQMCLWDEAHVRCDGMMASLGNLLEQLYACDQGSAFNCKALVEFKDLKEKLLHKLVKSIEHVLAELWQEMDTFESITKKMSLYRNVCFEEYHKCTDVFDLQSVVEASVDRPSIANLLEWIADLDILYHLLYEEKRHILARVSYDSHTKGQSTNGLSEWTSTRGNSSRMKGIKEQVYSFTWQRGHR